MIDEQTPRDTPNPPEIDKQAGSRARRAVAVYGLYRLGLFIALTMVIQTAALLIDAPVPLIMSALLALIVAFPLSVLIFRKQRLAANFAMEHWKRQREARREWIRGELAER